MPNIIQKNIETLNDDERRQIRSLIIHFFPYLNESYVLSWTEKGPDFDVVMIKEGDQILGVSYYKTYKLKTPFHKKEIPVIHFGLALKKPGFSGNVIGKMGKWYCKREIGPLFPFKRLVGVSEITTPRVMENFIKRFPLNSMNFPDHSSNTIFRFIQKFFYEKREMKVEIDYNSCFEYHTGLNEDVSKDWPKYFKGQNEKVNDLFFSTSIFKKEEDKVYKTAKAFIACGYRAGFSRT